MAKNPHPRNELDDLKLGVSASLLAIVQSIQESDKTYRDRLLLRIEASLREVQNARMTQATDVLAAFLATLKNPKNFSP
jgi:hypothetical protein